MQLQGQGQAAPAQDKSLAGDLAVAKALQAAKTAEKVVKTAD